MHLKTKGLVKKADYILYANFERGISNKMPGLEQLKQFSEDVAKIGNELTIREERGEPIVQVPFPTDISAEDDSDDFVLGMPLQGDEGADDGEDGDGISDAVDPSIATDESGQMDYSAFPELDSLLNPEPADNMDFSDFPELDALLNPASPEAPPAADLDNSLADVPVLDDDVLGNGLASLDLPDFDSVGTSETTGEDALDDGLANLDLPDFDNMGPDIAVDSDESNAVELDFNGQLYGEQSDSEGLDSPDTLQEAGADDSLSPASFDLPDFDTMGPDIAVDSDDSNAVELDFNGQLSGDQPESVDFDSADAMDTDVAADAGATTAATGFDRSAAFMAAAWP